jgi:1-acyl-sn-glycerol-3-phosphate acyltransferase
MQDSAYTLQCFEENLRPIAEQYFGAEMVGAENLPVEEVGKRAIVLVGNHSGMGLSWDNIVLDFLVYDRLVAAWGDVERAVEAKPVRMVDSLFLTHETLALFGIRDWWRRTGCEAATSANLEAAVRGRRIVIVSPEGVAGIAKGPRRRYQLQRFSSSFLRMAHAYGALVVPVSVVNAEDLNPWNVSVGWVNRLGRRLGFPFVPLGAAVLQAVLPATYLTPRRVKLTYVLHPAIAFEGGVVKTYAELRAEAEAFRREQQVRLDAAVAAYGRRGREGAKELAEGLRPGRWHEMFLRTAGEPWWLAALYKVPLGYPAIAVARWWAGRR